MSRQEWILKRNCSISPRQLTKVYAALCAVPLAVALFLAASGAWYVLGFAILELLAVGLAFLHFGRHAGDREQVTLFDGNLSVELIQAGMAREFRLDPRATRVGVPAWHGGLVRLEARGASVEVGRFVMPAKRREFALQLRETLRVAAAEWKEAGSDEYGQQPPCLSRETGQGDACQSALAPNGRTKF